MPAIAGYYGAKFVKIRAFVYRLMFLLISNR